MNLTNEIVEKHGFKRINNSMWRLGNITLQNGYTHEGNTIYEKILNTKKGYKVNYLGKFVRMIINTEQLNEVKKLNGGIVSGSFIHERYIKCPHTDKKCEWRLSDNHKEREYLNSACYLSGSFPLKCPK